jgi:ABC-type lipoprotein export system ATPase subunit
VTIDKQKIREFIDLFHGDTAAAIEELQNYSSQKPATKHISRSDTIITIQNLSKFYKLGQRKITALNNISLEISAGEFVALTGASGSGKSTLLQIIGGIDMPSSGSVAVDGTPLSTLSDRKLSRFRNRTIGFIFQFFYLQPYLRLNKNIEVPGMFARVNRKERQARVKELVETVGLADQINHFPKQLSGGQIQRAAIARALLNSPKILLADEPTGNLDSENTEAIINLFRHIQNEFGTTVIIVTHNPEIARHADREIRLSDGIIV